MQFPDNRPTLGDVLKVKQDNYYVLFSAQRNKYAEFGTDPDDPTTLGVLVFTSLENAEHFVATVAGHDSGYRPLKVSLKELNRLVNSFGGLCTLEGRLVTVGRV